MTAAKKAERRLAQAFVALLSCVIGFLIVEYLSRLFLTSRAPLERRFPIQNTRMPKPYVMFGGKPNTTIVNEGSEEQLNHLGYRGPAPEMPKPEGEFRVFILGGSSVLNGSPPIGQILEERCREQGFSETEVYNFGVISSVSSQELARVVFEISGMEPDLVIFYNGSNDLFQPLEWDPRPGYPFNYLAFEFNPTLASDPSDYPTFAMFAYGSNILRKVFQPWFVEAFVPLDEIRREANWKSDAWQTEIAEIYTRNLLLADNFSKSIGARFMGFFQPVVYFKDELAEEEEEFGNKPDERKHAFKMRDKVLASMDKLRKTSSLKAIDASSFFEREEEVVFTDYVHTNQKAKKSMAGFIFEKLIEHGMLDRKGGGTGDEPPMKPEGN